jgi:hypothetical protein
VKTAVPIPDRTANFSSPQVQERAEKLQCNTRVKEVAMTKYAAIGMIGAAAGAMPLVVGKPSIFELLMLLLMGPQGWAILAAILIFLWFWSGPGTKKGDEE